MKRINDRYRNGNCVIAFVDDSSEAQPLDIGFDYYAPQTMLTPDGRRIAIAWMQAPDSGSCVPEEMKWFGQMTFPREMTVKDGRIYQLPISEIQNLYKKTVTSHIDAGAQADLKEKGIYGRVLDMTVDTKGASYCQLKFAMKNDIYVEFLYDKKTGYMTIDRSHSGRSASVCEYRKILIGKYDDLKVRLLLDRFSFELFINDGEHAASGTLYDTDPDADLLEFVSDGEADIKFNRI